MAIAEARPGSVEKQTTEANELVWDIGLEARSVLPGDVKSISAQVLRWMNPEQGWQIRRITALGYNRVSDRPIPQEQLEQFLTDETLSVDPGIIIFVFNLRSANPPELNEKRGFNRNKVFTPQKMFDFVVNKVGISDLFNTNGPIISFPGLPYTEGILSTSEPNVLRDVVSRYYFVHASVYLNANRTLANTERMSQQDRVWPNIFLELCVGNTYGAITTKMEELKRSLEAMENEATGRRKNPTDDKNTSQISS